ncbi:MAG: triose-phosphate isomerase [Candidatus Spechtbacteria bacterium RIFCSPLOWO2_01_FULL_43_12]|uniref:Triosephosphate isomerase n=1 Tax=Candidatus Spechtbacteria bacterium RIFCSPLOWO2_01_FULL_43_12 TaxID=1802162 RepID=A0A1G2HDN6_9BACT|nr:MAG: triose-phosphate isomerase [Candidatus Spechtbacteria bacterium RIFCSPLOWO2_01_FULL_43_12]
MKNKKKYLVANWKMNPVSAKDAGKLAGDIVGGSNKIRGKKGVDIVICPPFPFLQIAGQKLGSGVKLGAQNCYFEDSGAYTGEVSARILKSLNCHFIIVGHSERRKYFNEDSLLINKKLKAIFKNGLVPIFAVGEKAGESVKVVERQLRGGLKDINGSKVKNIIIAYEPVWAIGTGHAATADDVMGASIMIRRVLADLYSRAIADKVPILYGGSTDSKNISRFTKDAGMDGALVGGSSLNAKEFIKMAQEIVK